MKPCTIYIVICTNLPVTDSTDDSFNVEISKINKKHAVIFNDSIFNTFCITAKYI